jgi:Protein of unknown function (Hypoth_ymh)
MKTSAQRFYERIKSKISKEADLANFFTYHLTIELGRKSVTVSAVKSCYEECDLLAPSWLASHFSAGLRSKPRRFIKSSDGYRLEAKLRDHLAALLGKEHAAAELTADKDSKLAGIEYAGIAGGSKDCQDAIEMLLQYGRHIRRACILTCGSDHCILLSDEVDDLIAIKSGFASGYGGEGPRTFSYVLQLLESHGADIEEYDVDESTIERLDDSVLTQCDLDRLEQAKPTRGGRWRIYVDTSDFERAHEGTLWRDFPPVVPFAVIDSRIMDLAISFWRDPDDRLLKGYRRLEDLVRARTNLQEHGRKLFSQAFLGDSPKLTWPEIDDNERVGRGTIFTAAYMAHRNPRAHRVLNGYRDAQLSEFLLLNHLFRLEREAR